MYQDCNNTKSKCCLPAQISIFSRKVLCKDIDNAHSMCDPNYGLTIERCGGEGEAGCGLVALFFTGPYLLFGGAIIALLYIASTVLGVQWLIA